MNSFILQIHLCILPLLLILSVCKPSATGSKVLSVNQVWQDAASYDGKTVQIKGHVIPGDNVACTRRACTPEEKCCNTCGASTQLVAPAKEPGGQQTILLVGEYRGKPIGCRGDECSLNCQPAADSKVSVRGKLKLNTLSQPSFELRVDELKVEK